MSIYQQLIQRALNANRIKSSSTYYEQHHITPRCMGGSNKKDNLVLLTAKEHFLAHKLLCKVYSNQPKLVYAYWMMCSMGNKKQNRYTPSSRSYQEAKELMVDVARKKQLGIGFRPCVINGEYYIGIREAARILNIKETTLRNRLVSNNPDCYFWDQGSKKALSYKGRVKAKNVIVNGTNYPSIYAAAKALNTSIAAIRYRIKVDGKGDKFSGIHCV